MKKLLAILLSVSVIFSFSLGTAFAAEGEEAAPAGEEPAVETPVDDPVQTEEPSQEVEKQAPEKKKITVSQVKNVKVKALSSSSLRVTWKGVSGAKGYKVYKYSKKSHKYVLVKTIKSGKTHTYKNTGLKASKKYTYKVAAYKISDGKKYTGKKSNSAVGKTKAVRGAKAVSVARSKLGCSYVSGCAGPSRFDCSGFVYYVYNKKGAGKVKFSRSSAQGEYNQLKKYKVGSSIKSAKKGDILFFSSSGSTHGIYHTGIYIGNGKMIHAANPRKGVCVAKTSWCPRVCAVVRISK